VSTPSSYFAVVTPGLEELTAAELAALPSVAAPAVVPGGVAFAGPPEALYRANLWLRTATRVLRRVGEVEAARFDRLRARLAALPLAALLDPRAPVEVEVTAHKCRLYHSGAVAERVHGAVEDALGRRAIEPARAPALLLLRGVRDRWTLSLDSSGEPLYRRGWRAENARAPLRETLAAALLLFAGYDPAQPLLDPFCGAGTLALEACALALGRAPGLDRDFAFTRAPGFDAALWRRLLDEARSAVRPAPPAAIFASDLDAGAIEAARRNTARAGLAAHVAFDVADATRRDPPAPSGLLVANLPYGRRVGKGRLAPLYRDLARALARFSAWRLALLTADRDLPRRLHLPLVPRAAFSNGGLRVTLFVRST
jgi:putative N6-adenine-specific DNA methylase